MKTLSESCFSPEAWIEWAVESIDEFIEKDQTRISDRKHDATIGESPAIEVARYRLEKGYFASSTDVRLFKSKDVRFSVGQVVKHKTLGYRGVIIGWDSVAKAPESWLRRMHSKEKWREMPNYAIFVDTRDRSDPQMTYVPQELLELQQNRVEVRHPELEDYFIENVEKTYIAQFWLRQQYPED